MPSPSDTPRPAMSARQTSLTAAKMHIKRVTLTSKKNWWMVEMDQDDDHVNASSKSFSSSEDTAVAPDNSHYHRTDNETQKSASPNPSAPVYNTVRHPTSIFSFPTPTGYCAPGNPTANLSPVAQGSVSEVFKCVVKKPAVVQLEINGEMQSNASDVTTQFLAELRVYTTVARHRNIVGFLGCLENVGMVLEYIEGRTLYEVIRARPMLTRAQKIDYHNQLLSGLTHLHSYRLSHGDLSVLNIHVTHSYDTIKLLDFGRSVSANSIFLSPTDEPVDPFVHLARRSDNDPFHPTPRAEQIHPGTRPFSAPEVLRGECMDPLLADAYSFGMILVCIDRCELVDVKPWEQRKDVLPAGLYDGCEVFSERCKEYLRSWDSGRRRLMASDIMHEVPEGGELH